VESCMSSFKAMEIQEESEEILDERERVFSVVLKSKSAIKIASLGANGTSEVLIEGSLGTLKSARFLDEILEVFGTFGVLRLDLVREELSTQHARPVANGIEKN
jgi:hypothetical protein